MSHYSPTSTRDSFSQSVMVIEDENESIDELISRLTHQAEETLNAYRCVLFFVSESRQEMCAMYLPNAPRIDSQTSSHARVEDQTCDDELPLPSYLQPLILNLSDHPGVLHDVAINNKAVVIADVQHPDKDQPVWDFKLDRLMGLNFATSSLMCLPIASTSGTVYAVLLAINKLDQSIDSPVDSSDCPFENLSLNNHVIQSKHHSSSPSFRHFAEQDLELGIELCEDMVGVIRRRITSIVLLRTELSLSNEFKLPLDSLFELYGQTSSISRCMSPGYSYGAYNLSRSISKPRSHHVRTTSSQHLPLHASWPMTQPRSTRTLNSTSERVVPPSPVFFPQNPSRLRSFNPSARHSRSASFQLTPSGLASLSSQNTWTDFNLLAIDSRASVTPLCNSLMRSRSPRVHREDDTDDDRSEVQSGSSWFTYFRLHDNVPTLEQLSSIEFDPFDWDDNALVHGCGLMIQHISAIDTFELQLDVLQRFLLEIKSKYRSLPYHNFKHGFAVMQFAFYVITNTGMTQSYSQLQLFALLVACLCHDVDHNGHTNKFEIASGSELAIRYYDESVLENHHLSVAFEIMRKPEMNFLHPDNSNFIPDQTRELRKIMISCILATDMSHDAEMCDRLNCLLIDRSRLIIGPCQFVLDVITHFADLSGQMLPWRIAQKWEHGITTEFMELAKQEKEQHLPLTILIQDLHIPCIRYNRQLEYMDFILSRLLTPFGELFPQLKPSLLQNLKLNRQHYDALSKEDPLDSTLSIHHPLVSSQLSDDRSSFHVSGESSLSVQHDGNTNYVAINLARCHPVTIDATQNENQSVNQSIRHPLTIDTAQNDNEQPFIEPLPHYVLQSINQSINQSYKFEALEEKSLDHTLSDEHNTSINQSVPTILDASEKVRRYKQDSEEAVTLMRAQLRKPMPHSRKQSVQQ